MPGLWVWLYSENVCTHAQGLAIYCSHLGTTTLKMDEVDILALSLPSH